MMRLQDKPAGPGVSTRQGRGTRGDWEVNDQPLLHRDSMHLLVHFAGVKSCHLIPYPAVNRSNSPHEATPFVVTCGCMPATYAPLERTSRRWTLRYSHFRLCRVSSQLRSRRPNDLQFVRHGKVLYTGLASTCTWAHMGSHGSTCYYRRKTERAPLTTSPKLPFPSFSLSLSRCLPSVLAAICMLLLHDTQAAQAVRQHIG